MTNISDQIVFKQLKQRIIDLLSNNSEVETNEYSAQKITYTMLANICNALFIRHRVYPTNFDEKSIIEIWKLAVKRLYGFNEISETEYKNTVNHINLIHNIFHLISLQVTNHMPSHISRHIRNFID